MAEVDGAAWDQVVAGRGLYLQRHFLAALEDPAALEDGVDSGVRYVLFERDGTTLGVARFELAAFRGPELRELLPEGRATTLATWLAGVGDGPLHTSTLVCGSSFVGSDCGFAFVSEVEPAEAARLLGRAVRRLQRGARQATVLFKEFLPDTNAVSEALSDRGYAEVAGGDRMVLSLDPAWADFDHYLAALRSKFRVKARRALTRSAALEVRPLDRWDLWQLDGEAQALLDQVCARSHAQLGCIDVAALGRLRAVLDEEMVVQGYFLDGELVGFLSAFVLGDTLDAHVVGIDYAHNRAHGIYPRMLVDFLQLGLARGVSRIDYGRTAEEIKSTLGARPVPTQVYLRHDNVLVNPVLGRVAQAWRPEVPVLRAPFKERVATGLSGV